MRRSLSDCVAAESSVGNHALDLIHIPLTRTSSLPSCITHSKPRKCFLTSSGRHVLELTQRDVDPGGPKVRCSAPCLLPGSGLGPSVPPEHLLQAATV